MIFLTSEVMEAVRGQKHPSEAKNIMKELIYWKKYLMKVSQQPQKPLSGSNQIWATTSGTKDTATSEVTATRPNSCCYVHWIKHTAKQLRSPQSGIPSVYICLTLSFGPKKFAKTKSFKNQYVNNLSPILKQSLFWNLK